MNLEKFESINNRMNKITEELHKNIGFSEELLTTTDELADILTNPTEVITAGATGELSDTQSTELQPINELAATVVDAGAMLEDFSYMRQRLRETTENNKRVLESVTEELIHSDGESRAGLVMAYSELNKAQLDGMRLFMQSYKEISTILVNLAKVQNSGTPNNSYTTNVLSIEGSENVNVSDIVKRLRKTED